MCGALRELRGQKACHIDHLSFSSPPPKTALDISVSKLNALYRLHKVYLNNSGGEACLENGKLHRLDRLPMPPRAPLATPAEPPRSSVPDPIPREVLRGDDNILVAPRRWNGLEGNNDCGTCVDLL